MTDTIAQAYVKAFMRDTKRGSTLAVLLRQTTRIQINRNTGKRASLLSMASKA